MADAGRDITMTLTTRQDAALEPVRTALAIAADARVTSTLAAAEAAAAALLTAAQRAADEAVSRAAAEGAADARPAAMADLARSRRTARSMALEADRATEQYLADRIRAAVLALRDEAGYPPLRDRLSKMAASAAGPGAALADHQDGGVIATAPGVVVDCSLGKLADRAIAALGARIAALCAASAAAGPGPGHG
jgi:cell division septum initiation protein DivIVA